MLQSWFGPTQKKYSKPIQLLSLPPPGRLAFTSLPLADRRMTGDLLHNLQEPLQDELAEAIAKARGGKGTGAMAYELPKRDKRSHQLIGVVEQGQRVVFYDPSRWSVVATPFDKSGVDGNKRFQWEKIKERVTVERFVREKGEDCWTWVHPRYRWVFELG